MTEIRTVEQESARQLSQHVDSIIERFGDLVRDLRLIQTQVDNTPGVGGRGGSYARLAAKAPRAIMDTLFNADAHTLVMRAAEADAARVKRVVAETIAAAIDAEVAKVRDSGESPHTGAALAEYVGVGARVAREYAAKEG